jgi:tryptophanyl-tRNA synthetase
MPNDADPGLSYAPDRRPGVANLATVLGALTGTAPADALAGLRGAAALKQALIDALVETLTPIQKRYQDLADDPAELERLLRVARDTITPDALRTVARAREAMGLFAVA